MKNFRKFSLGLVLAAIFAAPVLAGDVHTPGSPAPGEAQTSSSTDPGDEHTPGRSTAGITQMPGYASNGEIAIALFVIQASL